MPVDPTAEDPRDRVTKRRAMVSCCVRSCFRASFSFFHVFFSLFFCPLITCSRYVRGEVGYSVHMQRGNYLSAIIITKGPVGSSRQLSGTLPRSSSLPSCNLLCALPSSLLSLLFPSRLNGAVRSLFSRNWTFSVAVSSVSPFLLLQNFRGRALREYLRISFYCSPFQKHKNLIRVPVIRFQIRLLVPKAAFEKVASRQICPASTLKNTRDLRSSRSWRIMFVNDWRS